MYEETTTTAGEATTTTEVPRVVGDPLPTWVVVGSGVGLLLVILLAGYLVRRRGARA